MGGLGEIGKNMTIIEYGRKLIVVDAGIMFPSNDMPGVDYILPDYSYLVEHQDMLLATPNRFSPAVIGTARSERMPNTRYISAPAGLSRVTSSDSMGRWLSKARHASEVVVE